MNRQSPLPMRPDTRECLGRRTALQSAAAVLAVFASPFRSDLAMAFDLDTAMADRIIGDPNAPNTLEDFSSLTCPHCKAFHEGALEELKEGPIKDGRLRVIYRDFPLNGLDLHGAMLARCAKPNAYFALIDVFYATQETWPRASDPLSALRSIGLLSGMSNAEIDACWQRNDLAEALVGIRQEATDRHGITGTPGLVLNGRNIAELRGSGLVDAILDELDG